MLAKQKELIDYIAGLEQLLKPFEGGDKQIYAPEKLGKWREQIIEQELIIPVVGGFSTGKSTLINAFLGEEYLPVAITPETSLAAELHYVASPAQERLELLHKNGQSQVLAKEQFQQVKQQAQDSRLVRVYLNNENLRKIEPLILVDMPGFESPLDAHNESIFSYIEKGVHYLILISVEDGSISKSMVRQISDIQSIDSAFQRNFSFFLSKANLRPESDVQKVKRYLEEQLGIQLDIEKPFVPLGENGAAEFEKVLASVDPNALFPQIYRPALKEVFYDLTGNINVLIAALKKDFQSNADNLKELAASKAKIEKKQQQAIAEAESRYSASSVESIVHYVGSQLSSAIEELVAAAKHGGDSLSQRIGELTRSALIRKTGEVLEHIADSIASDFALELESLNDQMMMDKMGQVAFTYAEQLKDRVLKVLKGPTVQASAVKGLSLAGAAGKVIGGASTGLIGGTIAGFAIPVIGPLVGIVLAFLPEIIGFFTKGTQEAKQNDAIRQQILTAVIPDVKRKIGSELRENFQQQVQGVIEQISEQFRQQLAQHEESIQKAQEEYEQHKDQLGQRIEKYETLRQELEHISKPVLFS